MSKLDIFYLTHIKKIWFNYKIHMKKKLRIIKINFLH